MTVAIEATILGYLATLLCAPLLIYTAGRGRSAPSLGRTLLVGGLAGSVAPECQPWVWFLQGDVGSPLFFVYVLSGTFAGLTGAASFWLIAFRNRSNSPRNTALQPANRGSI
jgi:hypothetical protein